MELSMTEGFESKETEEDEMDVLDEKELAKLQFFAEHPELDNPFLWFIPKKRKNRRGGSGKGPGLLSFLFSSSHLLLLSLFCFSS